MLDQIIADASALIRLRSENPPGSEHAVAEWVCRRLAGVSTTSVQYVAAERSNAIALIDLGPGPELLLCTHLDVVPAATDDQFEPQIANGRLIGRGSCDAKGALAAMISVVESIAEQPRGLWGRLTLAAVADEESGAQGIDAFIRDRASSACAVIGEPTSNRALFASRGVVRVRAVFNGQATHASAPARGVNAVSVAARFILALEDLDQRLRGRDGSCAATVVAGGTLGNVIPAECYVQIDRRLGPHESATPALDELDELVRRIARDGNSRGHLTPGGANVEPFDLRGSSFANEVLAALGRPHSEEVFQAVTDAPMIVGAGTPTVILGPGSLEDAHTATESVSLADLAQAAADYSALVRYFLARDSSR